MAFDLYFASSRPEKRGDEFNEQNCVIVIRNYLIGESILIPRESREELDERPLSSQKSEELSADIFRIELEDEER